MRSCPGKELFLNLSRISYFMPTVWRGGRDLIRTPRHTVGVKDEILERLRKSSFPGQDRTPPRLLVALLGPGFAQQRYDVARVDARIATDELLAAFRMFQGRLF